MQKSASDFVDLALEIGIWDHRYFDKICAFVCVCVCVCTCCRGSSGAELGCLHRCLMGCDTHRQEEGLDTAAQLW